MNGLLPFVQRLVLTIVLGALLMPLIAQAQSPGEPRRTYNFNPDWKLLVGDPQNAQAPEFDDSQWQPVTLPHAWNEDSAFKVSIDDLPTGIAWYRKHFKMPADTAGRRVFIEFQGIRQGGEFWVNGKSLGLHENGIMAFGFDITDALNPPGQDNVIAARIDNSWSYKEKATGSPFQWNDKNFYANYGGINKNVLLHVTGSLYQTLPLYSNLGTTGVYVYASSIDLPSRSATITAEAEVKNDDSKPATFAYQVAIADMTGKIVKTFEGGQHTAKPGEKITVSASAKIDNLNFWSWGYGYLYTVSTTLTQDGKPVDVVHTRTGFRKTEFANGMLKLNGRALQVHGYAQRTTNEWPALGINVPPWVSDFSNGLMVQSNGNLVRWMHVTPSRQDVESCDRVGLIQAMPAGDSEGDPTGRRWDLRVLVMRDAMIYNRNNPSILFYETGNKGVREEHMKEMVDTRNQWDPHGGRAIGSREMLDPASVAEYGGEMLYINKSAGKPLWAMEYSRDEGLRSNADEFTPPYHKNGDGPQYKGAPAPSYNHNQDSFAIEDVRRWYDYWRERPGTGDRVSGGGVNIIFSDSNTHHRGSENYRTSGEVDAMRLPKDAFYAHQVMWDGWVNVDKPAAFIIGHWNYKPGTKKDINVVSSAERVEILLNGKSLGAPERNYQFLFTMKGVAWQPGTLKAIGYASNGAKVCETEIATTGEPASIKLTPHLRPGGMRADGSDLALVDVEVVDAQGRRVPTAFNDITFDLTGPAEWRGGIARGADNHILAKTLPVELGINRVALRSQPKAGVIHLSAAAHGLKAASIDIPTQAVEVTEGLALTLPDEGLLPALQRGPTPAGDGLVKTRLPVKVTRISATSNDDQAKLTMDDNETTGWSNDGTAAGAEIRYDFARPARVSEVTMKLAGWRTKSYPIRILVDKQVVFTGTTPQSLGYVTLTFPPTPGKSLTIDATGAARDEDAFNDIVEVTGKKDTAGTTPRKPSGKANLSINEIEIYEPVPAGAGARDLPAKESIQDGARSTAPGTDPDEVARIDVAAGAANQRTPTTRPEIVVTPPDRKVFAIYLLIGQSNMVGRDTRAIDAEPDNPHILALNPEGKWVIARDPLHHPPGQIAPGVGPGLTFAMEMLKADPTTTIGLVPCAVGGTPLRRWEKGGDLYNAALDRAKLAAQAGQLRGVLWHQGEADAAKEETAKSYESRLTQMFKDLRADLGTPELPIVVGQLGPFLHADKEPFADTVRTALKNLPATDAHVGFADSTDLTDKGDHLHFSTDSQREFGRRYAAAMIAIEKKK